MLMLYMTLTPTLPLVCMDIRVYLLVELHVEGFEACQEHNAARPRLTAHKLRVFSAIAAVLYLCK